MRHRSPSSTSISKHLSTGSPSPLVLRFCLRGPLSPLRRVPSPHPLPSTDSILGRTFNLLRFCRDVAYRFRCSVQAFVFLLSISRARAIFPLASRAIGWSIDNSRDADEEQAARHQSRLPCIQLGSRDRSCTRRRRRDSGFRIDGVTCVWEILGGVALVEDSVEFWLLGM